MASLPDIPGAARDLLSGTAGCSPYLARLMEAERDWLAEALAAPPEETMAGLVAAARAAEGPETGKTLRGLKRRAALLIGLADLAGAWDVAEVTAALTGFADAALAAALSAALLPELKRGKLPGQDETALDEAAGMVALAMGKMGAGELNYSSDIDLICLFDESRYDPGDEMEARAAFVRATRRMAATLSENTAEGYVFRTDLRLRPDASVTPVCISMAAAERYYEAEGRTWERAAYIKARPAAGDLEAGGRFLETLRPFVWRRHLDFAAIHETQDMRRRIKDHKGLHGGFALEGHNVKLGPGGIREIEFFAQTRQLIAGGRDAGLRLRRTLDALAALAERGWIEAAERDALSGHYNALRTLEHRLQMLADAQTHALPQTPDGFDRLARFMGESDTAAFRDGLMARFRAVHAQTEPFFAPRPGGTERDGSEPVLSDTARETIARWPGYPALRSMRGQEIFARLRPELLNRLAAAAKPDEALAAFDGFLHGLPAGVQIFSLFEANPALVDLIVDICVTSPGLARYLSRNSEVLDAVIGGDFFAPWPGSEALREGLARMLRHDDYEGDLDAARVWQKEWHFRAGVHFLRGLTGAAETGDHYADIAGATLAGLWPLVQADLARRHGAPPGNGAAVVGMGSLGAGALTAGSDLDLIVIYDAPSLEMSDGPRPIDARAWYAKATKALVAALSAPTAHGTLYEVDMRLRPSGRQGPVATALSGFEPYQMEEAWTWEHLALTRARPLAGPPALKDAIEDTRRRVIAAKGDRDRVLAETARMRLRLAEAGRTGSTFAVKAGPGGTQDIELLAQAGTLICGSPARSTARQLAATVEAGVLSKGDGARLAELHARFESVRQAGRLLGDRPPEPEGLGAGAAAFLCRAGGAEDLDALARDLDAGRAEAAGIVDAALPQVEDET
ncbi:bifunctional [glutamine synthetase] adenylyltransferase/[glutamine synthetase]-adenylyl-L-tyrosine phosphorylase [Rhodobacterales bacterium HKCCE2091]|nr:bifunctional [glutamine synthetase] adenylyltransferase/[glutamine synthetase]-adenylyl-L-tyrosine phosphorylase [Rhodobacterales bacterium HKCCE2091]